MLWCKPNQYENISIKITHDFHPSLICARPLNMGSAGCNEIDDWRETVMIKLGSPMACYFAPFKEILQELLDNVLEKFKGLPSLWNIW